LKLFKITLGFFKERFLKRIPLKRPASNLFNEKFQCFKGETHEFDVGNYWQTSGAKRVEIHARYELLPLSPPIPWSLAASLSSHRA